MVSGIKSDTVTDEEDFTHTQIYKIIEYNPILFIAGFMTISAIIRDTEKKLNIAFFKELTATFKALYSRLLIQSHRKKNVIY